MAPPKAHVKRIFKTATNPDTGEVGIVTDYFVDVRRTDEMTVNFQSTLEGKQGQMIRYKFIWNDNPNDHLKGVDDSNADIQYENANAKRKTRKRRIKDPDVPSDKDNELSINDNDILLWMVERLKIQLPRGDIFEGQVAQFVFNDNLLDSSEGDPSQSRVTAFMKIVNNDLNNKLKMADDDGKNPVMVDWATYKQALQNGNIDKTDPFFIVVEMTDKFSIRFQPDQTVSHPGLLGQRIVFVLNVNKIDVESLFEQLRRDDIDVNQQIVRVDPFQDIVNVGSNIIAVEYAPEEQ
jgi:hypothetical protein